MGPAQSRKAWNILCDEDDIWVDVLGQQIGNHQVYDGICVHELLVEVLVVVAGETVVDSMVLVHHRGHGVEAEAIGVIFFQPKPDIGEQEAEDFVFREIENPAVPLLMSSSRPRVKILELTPIPLVYPLVDVLCSVGVDQVDHHLHLQPMGFVY